MGRRKIADEKEILAVFTAVMRGEAADWTTRKSGGTEESVAVPVKLGDRIHAAELLSKYYGLFDRGPAEEGKAARTPGVEALLAELCREVTP